jgi:hypothetical protein
MLRGPKDYLKIGDHNAWCGVCGMKYKATELRKRWDGMMVCAADFEMRHPQDFIRSVPEKPAPPYSRPRNDNVENPSFAGTPGVLFPGQVLPSQPMSDQAGAAYFVPFGPADKSTL